MIVFVLNLPWTILGILLALLSAPRNVRFHRKPFALIFSVRSFWWQAWLPGYKGVRAASIGTVILLGPKLLPQDLEHELIHVEQYQREPFIHVFLFVYQSLRYGYRKNKYEVEAYKRAGNQYVEK